MEADENAEPCARNCKKPVAKRATLLFPARLFRALKVLALRLRLAFAASRAQRSRQTLCASLKVETGRKTPQKKRARRRRRPSRRPRGCATQMESARARPRILTQKIARIFASSQQRPNHFFKRTKYLPPRSYTAEKKGIGEKNLTGIFFAFYRLNAF